MKFSVSILFLVMIMGGNILTAQKTNYPKLQQDSISVAAFRNEGYVDSTDLKGDIFKTLHVKDSYGDHYITFSKRKAGSYNYGNGDGEHGSYDNIYANGFTSDHGGLLKNWGFRDFGNEVYFPFFMMDYCHTADVDNDKRAECYVVSSDIHDGLDGDLIKVVVYYKYKKYKVSMRYPSIDGDEEEGTKKETYTPEYDPNWKQLPKSIQDYMEGLMKRIDEETTINQ